MKKYIIIFTSILIGLTPFISFSQSQTEPKQLNLPGDDLDLFAVLELFQKSKTIEEFEKTLNDEKTGINNLDLNKDEKVDFIKVETKKDGDNFKFLLQDPISDKKTQEVATINLKKDKTGKASLEIVGNKDLYGKNYVVKPKAKQSTTTTPNPAYTGNDPVKETTASTTTVVVVESQPIVQYVYSPVYVPYYPPYYYGYYPPYYRPVRPVTRAIYWNNRYDRYDDYRDDRYNQANQNQDQRNDNRNDNQDNRQGNQDDRQDGRNDNSSSKPKEGSSKNESVGSNDSKQKTTNNKEASRPTTSNSPSAGNSSSRNTTSQSSANNASRSNSSSYSGRSSSSASRSMSSGGGMSRGGGGGGRRR
jgi:uncharacterized membrane protein YgcG